MIRLVRLSVYSSMAICAIWIAISCTQHRVESVRETEHSDGIGQKEANSIGIVSATNDSIEVILQTIRRDRRQRVEIEVQNRSNQEYVVLPSFIRQGKNSNGRYRVLYSRGSLGIDLSWSYADSLNECIELNDVWPRYNPKMIAQFIVVPAKESILLEVDIGGYESPKTIKKMRRFTTIPSIPIWRHDNPRLKRLFDRAFTFERRRYQLSCDSESSFQSLVVGMNNKIELTFDEFVLLQGENEGTKRNPTVRIYLRPE